ncbi:Rpb7-binding seb1 [Hyphodiscus hymeniophilus]|uniref:Rpb7-binding seb1 n=1 Tax=Hyphodiscus hymeniophilus TaxID=353542 RepID=A0A9P6VHZ2_9HELO|nr:Rpb7-binding seb1 [Hyphodiscus hymeniophilus]
MSSPVADLEAGLQGMLSLKPPGVSGSRIASITALCTSNIQSESVLIQKLYTHFKKTPATHKLGVLYVVDSVTRKWTEQAKLAGQAISSAAEDGTFAAGVHRVKELLPVLMNDIIASAPDDQKEKIRKLVDIWEKGATFPLQMLTPFKEKLSASSQIHSTTPPGSPPSDIRRTLGLQQSNAAPAATAPDTSSILAALASMARQNISAAPSASNTLGQDSSFKVSNGQTNAALQSTGLHQQQTLQFPHIPQPVNVPASAATFAPQTQAPNHTAQSYPSNTNVFASLPPVPPPAVLDPTFQAQLMVIKMLKEQGITDDNIPAVLAAMNSQGYGQMGVGGFSPAPVSQYPVQNQNQTSQNGQNGWVKQEDESRDRDRKGPENFRSPDRFRRRSRSRSPPRGWTARDSPPRRHDGPNYEYDRDSPGRNRGGDDHRGRGNEYRQRSPPRRGRSPTPPRSFGGGEKWIGHEQSLGKNNIKVLSRTLFVGGVTCSEQELRTTFERFGKVQTCIVNKDKRHAFVKMISRNDAVSAKEAMEKNRTPDSSLRTRWGVGFGPRDCSDYQTGVSIIPISKLTDADRKWMLTAEFGGSGGKPIEAGMVVEEPDIEIGQGVSSKAISRRMQTDKGGNNGPKSSRDREEDERPPRFGRGSDEERRDRRRGDERNDRNPGRSEQRLKTEPRDSGLPSMPAVPPFSMPPGFKFATLPNGMPFIPPPGFPNFLASAQTQPPPPGHRS